MIEFEITESEIKDLSESLPNYKIILNALLDNNKVIVVVKGSNGALDSSKNDGNLN